MGILTPVFQIAGIAVGSEVVSRLMEENGHESKIIFVKVASYAACAYIALTEWWSLIHYVAHTFGVHI